MKKIWVVLGGVSLSVHLVYGDALTDLTGIYNQAASNNATYAGAEATYKAASYGIPIARANLLPSLTVAANTTANHTSPGSSGYFNSNGYTLTLTQALLNVGDWYTYSQAEATYKEAALTYGIALQTLIMSTASAYFSVLEAQDQLKYAIANQASLKEQLKQADIQYKVGLEAYTDVQSAEASYQLAVATTVADENNLSNAKENLAAIIGAPVPPLAPLKQNFPLLKPDPQNPDEWVSFGLQNNLALQSAAFQSEIARLGIHVDAATGYIPTVNAVGMYSNSKNATPSTTGPVASANAGTPTQTNGRVGVTSGSIQLNWNAFSGGATYATVKQDQYTYAAAVANQAQTRLQTETNVMQAYLNVLSDISQIQAYQQAVISGQASLKSMKAGYLVGTQTIVDVLTQQSNLFSSEQQYTQAIYSYINDSLNLKEQAGLLAPQDLNAINGWLDSTPAVTQSNS